VSCGIYHRDKFDLRNHVQVGRYFHLIGFLNLFYVGPITNILLAKIDTDDVNDGSGISIPFSVSLRDCFSSLKNVFLNRLFQTKQMERL
jgi:hypothetical protein